MSPTHHVVTRASIGGLASARRADHFWWRRNSIIGAEVRFVFDALKLLDPHLSQDLDCRDVVQPMHRWRCVNRLKQRISICAYCFNKGGALGRLFGKPLFLWFHPHRRHG
jgi:hypothetical protein